MQGDPTTDAEKMEKIFRVFDVNGDGLIKIIIILIIDMWVSSRLKHSLTFLKWTDNEDSPLLA